MIFRSFTLLALCCMTLLLCQFSPAMKGGDEAGVLAELPMVAGDFVGESEAPSEMEISLLPSDTIIVKRAYRTPGRSIGNRDLAQASLVIAGNDSRSIHRPEVCLDGQGWTLTDSRVREVKLFTGEVLQVRDLAIVREVLLSNGTKMPLRAHYIYWFVGADVTTPSNLERQLLSFSDNILRNVNHRWAYPSVMAWVTEGLPPEKTGQRMRSDEETVTMLLNLVRTLAPKFQKNLMSHS
ncbi:exosortase-associated EpsI family protein [Prosthecobacter sp.]|uniref:exosortase-associated EpsI family protein n=1 Tax=Prosthecobacter sp. TaxID=1965333 RepID=UPI0024875F92|nr:exosortase-associated EpsI family protein [Prosthecobacter sp.]MDI1311033.1 exosortase-associated EpsI family protein [Prosthecobacter sp.]